MIALILAPLFAIHAGVFLWRAYKYQQLRDALLVATFSLLTLAYGLMATNTLIPIRLGTITIYFHDICRVLALLSSIAAITLFNQARRARRR